MCCISKLRPAEQGCLKPSWVAFGRGELSRSQSCPSTSHSGHLLSLSHLLRTCSGQAHARFEDALPKSGENYSWFFSIQKNSPLTKVAPVLPRGHRRWDRCVANWKRNTGHSDWPLDACNRNRFFPPPEEQIVVTIMKHVYF